MKKEKEFTTEMLLERLKKFYADNPHIKPTYATDDELEEKNKKTS